MKKMAISFGIGATIGAGFSTAFSKASDNLQNLNKHLSSLEAQQSETQVAMERLNRSVDPKKYAEWGEELKKTEAEIQLTKNKMSQLEEVMKSNSETIITLNKQHAMSKSEIKSLNSAYEEKKKKHNDLKESLSNEANQISKTKDRLKELGNEIKNTSDPTGELRKEQALLTESLKKNQERYKQNRKELKDSSEALKKEKEAIANSRAENKKLEQQIGDTIKENKKLSTEYKKLENGLKKVEENYKKNSEAHKKAKDNMSKEAKELEELEKKYKSLTSEIDRAKKARDLYSKSERLQERSQKLSSAGTKSIATGTAGVGVVSLMANEGIKQQAAFSGVKRMFNFENEEDEEAFKARLENLIREKKMAVDIEELFVGASSVGQAGITDKDEAMKIVELGVKGGIAMDMARDEAISNFVALKKIFKLSYSELEQFADQLNYLGNTTGAGAAELIDFTKRLGSVGAEAGMSKSVTSAIGATIMDMGIDSDKAATGMKNIITAFTKGEYSTDKQKDMLYRMGLTPEMLAKNMQKDGEATFVDFFERLGKIKNKDVQVSILQEFFGKESLTSASNIATSLDNLKNNLGKVKGDQAKGSVDEEYDTGAETIENKMKNLIANFKLSAGRASEAIFPELEKLIININRLMDGIYEFQKANPKTFSTLFKVFTYGSVSLIALGAALKVVSLGISAYATYTKIAGFATEKAFGTKILSGVGKVAGGFKTLGNTVIGGIGKIVGGAKLAGGYMLAGLSKIGAGFKIVGGATASGLKIAGAAIAKFGIALLANPITWYIAAIVALIGAGYALYKNWDKIKAKGAELWQSVIEYCQPVMELWDTIKGKASDVFESWVDKAHLFKDGLKEALDGVFGWMTEKFQKLIDLKEKAFSFFSDKAEAGKSFLKNIPGFAEGGFVSAPTLAMVGEGAYSETIIPHDNSERSFGLWQKTGELIGAFDKKGDTSNSYSDSINYTYAPVIYANDSKGVAEVLKKDREISAREFEKRYEEMKKAKKRRGNGR